MWDPPPIRRLFTFEELLMQGYTRGELRYGRDRDRFVRVVHGIYAEGATAPTPHEIMLATMVRQGVPAWGLVAARIYDLDAVHDLAPPPPRRRRAADLGGEPRLVDGVLCASPLQVMVDLAAVLDDDRWEQANESALRLHLVTVEEETALLSDLTARRTPGVARIRRVLRLRPPGAPPTGSRLETIAVQIARLADGVPEPTRQHVVHNQSGEFVARLDLAWPDVGAFQELDGLGHRGQPVHDASRESAVVAATGWLCHRMTWREALNRQWAARRMATIIAQARRRPFQSD